MSGLTPWRRALTRWLWLATGVALVALPLLPAMNPGAKGLVWAPVVESWGIGLVSVVVFGLLCGWLAARRQVSLRWPAVPPRIVIPLLTVALAAGAAWFMRAVLAGNPHLVDEMAQLLDARAFAAGRLAAPVPDPPEAFLITHTWVANGMWFSQYPPDQTLLLALGMLAGATWLVNPILGGVSVVLMWYATRGLYGPKTALTATVLWAFSPWVLFMSGTYLNHVGAVTLSLGAWAALWGPRRYRPWHAVVAGLALAGVAATRPLDAVAAALPMLVWLAWRRRWMAAPLMALGGVPVMAALAYFNWRVYGNPLTLGYDVLYGVEHGLGFHTDPWGDPYTPMAGLRNMSLAVQRMNIYAYEWPIPALLPVVLWALFGRRRGWAELVVLTGLLAAPLLYFFYWHSGFYLGPRFYYAAAPWFVMATALAWRAAWRAARRTGARLVRADVALAAAAAAVLLWGWAGVVPTRVQIYHQGLATMKLHPERELAARGVRQALVLVPESFGSRVMVGLWSEGVLPGAVEVAYRRLDTCTLYQFLRQARSQNWSPDRVAARLEAMADAVLVPPAPLETWPDPSLKLLPGSTPPDICQVELRRDLEGFSLFGYLAWRNPIANDSGIVFARDLFERNDRLLARYPGWEVWRFAPPPGRPDTLPVLTRLSPPATASGS